MKRFLFLDDDHRRHSVFRGMTIGCDVVHVNTVVEACKALAENPPFDCVFLDHDLDEQSTMGFPSEETGEHVALFIAEHLLRERFPKNVVIHSWNPSGAERMRQILSDAGLQVRCVPFGSRKS